MSDQDIVRITGAHEGTAGPVLVATDAEDRILLLSTSDGQDGVCRWDPRTGERLWRAESESGGVNCLAAVRSAGGRWVVAAAGDSGVDRWDALTGESLTGREPREGTVWGLAAAYLTDGRAVLVGAGNGGEVHRWDPETGLALGEPLVGHRSSVKCVAAQRLSCGTTMIASGGDDCCVLRWDAATGETLGEPLECVGWVIGVALLPLAGGRTLIAAYDTRGALYRWDAESGAPIGRPVDMDAPAAMFSAVSLAGEPVLVASGDDEVVRQWHAVTGEPVDDARTGVASSCATRTDGTVLLATGTFDGEVALRTLGVATR